MIIVAVEGNFCSLGGVTVWKEHRGRLFFAGKVILEVVREVFEVQSGIDDGSSRLMNQFLSRAGQFDCIRRLFYQF